MKPVRQRRISATDGDCGEACLATIFECELDDVPRYPPGRQAEGDREWTDFVEGELTEWLAEQGCWLLHGDINPSGSFPAGLIWMGITKPGPLGSNHAVVMRGVECVWDPETGRGGRWTLHDLEQALVFVALDPAAHRELAPA